MSANFPALTPEAADLLLYVEKHAMFGRGPRLVHTKARDELKRLKLIVSRPINANVLLPAAAGGGYQWRSTPFGAEVAHALAKERA